MKKVTYDTNKFNFQQILKDLFKCSSLDSLAMNVEVFKRENDQDTPYHRKYYEFIRTPKMVELYTSFIKKIVRPLYEESIVYQAIPTFRIAFPNNIAVGEWHKDKFYRDQAWAREVKEDNFFLPFTNAFGTNTVWVESEEDKGDYSPIECTFGELVQWDGSNLMHGNKSNTTGKTRVSVDFRVIRFSNFKNSSHGSINTNTKFSLGEYYKEML